MKTSSKIRTTIEAHRAVESDENAPGESRGTSSKIPSYESMLQAVQKISQKVDFVVIKDFYGITSK